MWRSAPEKLRPPFVDRLLGLHRPPQVEQRAVLTPLRHLGCGGGVPAGGFVRSLELAAWAVRVALLLILESLRMPHRWGRDDDNARARRHSPNLANHLQEICLVLGNGYVLPSV